MKTTERLGDLYHTSPLSVTWGFDTISREQVDAITGFELCKFEIIYGTCDGEPTRVYKDCELTDVIEPSYTFLERLVRWVGSKLNVDCFSSFHQRETSYQFSVGDVEWMGE